MPASLTFPGSVDQGRPLDPAHPIPPRVSPPHFRLVPRTLPITGFQRRFSRAAAIVLLAHVPVLAFALAVENLPVSLGLAASMLLWIVTLHESRTLRGWAVRLPAEAVADLITALLAIMLAVCVPLLALGEAVWPIMLAGHLAFAGLTFQALFVRGRRRAWVRIVGSPSHLGASVTTFQQCSELLGRDACRFAPFRADRPEPEAWSRRIDSWLTRGETVLVLEPRLRAAARAHRRRGDVLFAEDCLLFAPMSHPAGPVVDLILGLLNQVVGLIALIVFSPLALALAALILLDDGGPVFFIQERVGYRGRRFRLVKFRSMRVDAPKYAVHPSGDDPRVTRMGRILRKFSLDELPQLINVLRGEMRLVGPRPEMPFIVETYSRRHLARLNVMPGITGLWQVSPHRNDPIHEHIEYDLAYIAHRNPILDLALILATFGLARSSGK